jgi:ABC-type sugar transport system permease subunit
MSVQTSTGDKKSGPLDIFSGNIAGTLIRLGGLIIIDAFAFWFFYQLIDNDAFFLAVIVLIVTLGVNLIFLFENLYPFRWFSPGLVLMMIMVVYPVLFTIYVAFTNYSTGNLLTKSQVIDRIQERPERRYRYLPEGEQYYTWTTYQNDDGNLLLWLIGRGREDVTSTVLEGETLLAYQDGEVLTLSEAFEQELVQLDSEAFEFDVDEELAEEEDVNVEEVIASVSLEGYTLLDSEAVTEAFSDISQLEYQNYSDDLEPFILNVASFEWPIDTATLSLPEEGFYFDPQTTFVIDYSVRSNGDVAVDKYKAFVFQPEQGNENEYALYLVGLVGSSDETFLALPSGAVIEGEYPSTINGYQKLSSGDLIRTGLNEEIIEYGFGTGEDPIRIDEFSAGRAGAFGPRFEYDEDDDVLIDRETGAVYEPIEGTFTLQEETLPEAYATQLEEGQLLQELEPGYYVVIGLDNFDRLVTDENIRGPFVRIFIWTLAHAFLAVFLTFWLGLALALLMNISEMPQRKLFRSLILIPYAIPAFISTLVWRGLLNPRLGLINEWLEVFLGEGNAPGWYSDPTWAKVGILLIQLWLGFPYMMLICTGALQSIPSDMYEAAKVDGAGAFQRFWNLTLPLLLVAVGPLLIASFAFNFNNFTVIELFNEGGPPIADSSVPAGHTDILITYTYEQAFSSGRGTDYAFASAISIFIFTIVAIITIFNYRFTRRWEEISQNV